MNTSARTHRMNTSANTQGVGAPGLGELEGGGEMCTKPCDHQSTIPLATVQHMNTSASTGAYRKAAALVERVGRCVRYQSRVGEGVNPFTLRTANVI